MSLRLYSNNPLGVLAGHLPSHPPTPSHPPPFPDPMAGVILLSSKVHMVSLRSSAPKPSSACWNLLSAAL